MHTDQWGSASLNSTRWEIEFICFRIYDEIQKIEANEFRYQEQVRIKINECFVYRLKI